MESDNGFFNQLGEKALDIAEGIIKDRNRSLRNDGKNQQRNNDIIAAVKAFLDLKVKEERIYDLLMKYFDVSSVSEVQQYLFDAKYQNLRDALSILLHDKYGMSDHEIIQYRKDHGFYELLEAKPELVNCTAEKLKTMLDKNSTTNGKPKK